MTEMMTHGVAEELFGVEHYDWLDRHEPCPTVTRSAAQGDVTVLRVTTKPAAMPLPAEGVVVMQAAAGGHTHTLLGEGFFDPATDRERAADTLLLGTLTVPATADRPVILDHKEHGTYVIAPGTYRIGSQREYAGEWRQVAD